MAILRIWNQDTQQYEPIPAIKGADGYTPQKGIDYFDGERGEQGPPGYTPIKNVDYFDGGPGPQGKDGEKGDWAHDGASFGGGYAGIIASVRRNVKRIL